MCFYFFLGVVHAISSLGGGRHRGIGSRVHLFFLSFLFTVFLPFFMFFMFFFFPLQFVFGLLTTGDVYYSISLSVHLKYDFTK